MSTPAKRLIPIASDDHQRRIIIDTQDTQRRAILNQICLMCENSGLLFTRCKVGEEGVCPLDNIMVALKRGA